MDTVVQTYMVPELSDLVTDKESLDRWNKLVEECGLQGQTKLVSVDKSPIPFLHMNKTVKRTFETLCEESCPVEEFAVTPIPVELLDLVALSQREKYFNRIVVRWDDVHPDPVIIGEIGYHYEMTFYNDSRKSLDGKRFATKQEVVDAGGKHPGYVETASYLIGRWGDEGKDLRVLLSEAIERYKAQQKNKLQKEINEATQKLSCIEQTAYDHFH